MRVISKASLGIIIILGACKNPEQVKPLYSYGLASDFTVQEQRAFGGANAIEISYVNHEDQIRALAPLTGDLSSIFLFDLMSGAHSLALQNARFAYVMEHEDTYYAFALINKDIYVYSSEDLFNWELQVNPVLTHSEDTNSIYYSLWNVGVAVDNLGTWHLLVESANAAGTANQIGVGLAYAKGSWSGGELNFDSNKSTEHVIPNGGNPDLKFIDGLGLLAFHGQSNDPTPELGREWYTTASTLALGESTWVTHKDFLIGSPGIHVCDPHAIEREDGSILLGVSFDQRFLYTMTNNQGFEEIFTELTQ